MGTLFLGAGPGSSSTPTYRALESSDLPFALTTGNVYYLDPINGNDANSGTFPAAAVQSLAAGYALLTEGHNDVLVLIGNGLSSGSARLTAGFTWSKDAAHMVGVCSPGRISQRARIAPLVPTTAFANFFTVSGNGCYFSEIEFYQGFGTGVAAEVCMTVTGQRNVFNRCHLAGMNDTAGANSTTSRYLLMNGAAECLFNQCTIGDDTTARTAANASVEFKGGVARNIFEDCIFPVYATGGGSSAIVIYAAAAYALDRWTQFKNCRFLNAAAFSGGVAIAALATIAAASGGVVLLDNCQATGVTAIYSDAATQNQIELAGPVQAQVLTMVAPS